MPRIIVKCRYYKNASSGNLGGLMKYIAMRDGAERIPKDQKTRPATEQQQQFINEITSRNSVLKTKPEYKSYLTEKTRGSASEFIASAVESNPRLLETEEYLRYMALRPRAERIAGDHGLFSSDDEIDLDEEIKKLEEHKGNVYSVIVSVKREDAERLGYNTATRWRDMIRANIADIAKQHNMPITAMRWYGAFHNESHHPHVHLLLYSTANPDRSFIGGKGIEELRHQFGTEIFKDDLREVYDRQTDLRNKLTNSMRIEFKRLIDDVSAGKFIDGELLTKLETLAHRLNECSGKKQYGYLPKGVKALVDEIVDKISEDKTVARLYDLWYRAKCAVTESYSDTPPEKLPLSQEKAFKPIRNALVQEAVRLGIELSHADQSSNHYSENAINESIEREEETAGGHDDAHSKRTSEILTDVEISFLSERVQETNAVRSLSSKDTAKTNRGTYHRNAVINAALRFGNSLGRVFYKSYKKYDPEIDDVDKQLRREIRAVKNGENLVM